MHQICTLQQRAPCHALRMWLHKQCQGGHPVRELGAEESILLLNLGYFLFVCLFSFSFLFFSSNPPVPAQIPCCGLQEAEERSGTDKRPSTDFRSKTRSYYGVLPPVRREPAVWWSSPGSSPSLAGAGSFALPRFSVAASSAPNPWIHRTFGRQTDLVKSVKLIWRHALLVALTCRCQTSMLIQSSV